MSSSNPASQLVGSDQRRERAALGPVDKRGAPRPKRGRCDSSQRQTGAMPVGGWLPTRRVGNSEGWACVGVDRSVFAITDGLVRSRSTITTGVLGHPDPRRLHAFDQPEVVRWCALGRLATAVAGLVAVDADDRRRWWWCWRRLSRRLVGAGGSGAYREDRRQRRCRGRRVGCVDSSRRPPISRPLS